MSTDAPTVQQAWSAVMGEVTSLGKNQRNASQGFNFRGIDDVMNLLGPVLRTHGVSIIPEARHREGRDITTSKGTVMHEVVVHVDYTIIGPDGDTISGSAFGESSDAGDKATPKAMSVAFRTFLLQSLCLPTDEPDPDSESIQRGAASAKSEEVAKTRDGLMKATDADAVRRVQTWAESKGLLSEPTTDSDGNSVPLNRLFETTLARLGDTTADEQAEQRIKDSLGATEVPAEETKTEEAKA